MSRFEYIEKILMDLICHQAKYGQPRNLTNEAIFIDMKLDEYEQIETENTQRNGTLEGNSKESQE